MDLTELMAGLGRRTEEQVMTLWSFVLSGDLEVHEFVTAAAELVALASGEGQELALADFAREYAVQVGELPEDTPPPIAFYEDTSRLAGGLAAIVAGAALTAGARAAATKVGDVSVLPENRLKRLARSEVFEATQAQYGQAMKRDKRVVGWRRKVSSGSCPLCEGWGRGGKIYDRRSTMATHKGCHCRPVPVIKKR